MSMFTSLSFMWSSDETMSIIAYGGREHTSDTDVKVVIKLRADVFDKVCGVVETPLLFLPVCSNWIYRGIRVIYTTISVMS